MIRNLAEIKTHHLNFSRANRVEVAAILARRGEEARAHVREHATFRHRTGATIASVEHRVYRTTGGALLRLSSASKVASWLEFGTKPHAIVAKRRALVFFWLRISKMIFARRVQHPGTRPYKFLSAAADNAHAQLNADLRGMMHRLASKF